MSSYTQFYKTRCPSYYSRDGKLWACVRFSWSLWSILITTEPQFIAQIAALLDDFDISGITFDTIVVIVTTIFNTYKICYLFD